MKDRVLGFAVTAVMLSIAAPHAAVDTANTPWIPLFNGRDMTNWYQFINNQGIVTETKLIQVHDGILHFYRGCTGLGFGGSQPAGYVATKKEYSSYDVRLEMDAVESWYDTGLLLHSITPPDMVWPAMIECQIAYNSIGQVLTVGSLVKTTYDVKPHELPGWNVIEARVRGSQTGDHIVNNKLAATWINAVHDGQPLSKGKLLLQLEYYEVYYRNIEIRPYDSTFAPIVPRPAATRIDAASFDNMFGALETKASSDQGGQTVTSRQSGDWITFYRVDFGASSPSTFIARCMASGDSNKVRVLIDGPAAANGSGTQVAAASAPRSAFGTVEAPLAAVAGKHQVYLILDKGVSLNWFQFGGGVGVAPRPAGQGLQAPFAVGAAYSDRLCGDVVFPLSLARPGDVRLSVSSLNGRSLFRTTFRQLAAGATNLRVSRSVGRHGDGTWVYTLSAGGHTRCGTVMIEPR